MDLAETSNLMQEQMLEINRAIPGLRHVQEPSIAKSAEVLQIAVNVEKEEATPSTSQPSGVVPKP